MYQELINILGKENVFTDEDMSKHTTFKAGGKAKYFVTPDSFERLSELIGFLKDKIDYYIIGNGSNLLVKDEGYNGVIVKIGQKLSNITLDDKVMSCEAGAYVSKIANYACENSLSGLEFAAGIPGMLGGAVAMNAGAYGGEFKDIIMSVTLMDKYGNIVEKSNEEMKFGYRNSVVQEEDYIVLSAKLKLEAGNKDEISDRMNELLMQRRDKQPLEYPSAGSTFKRPEGYFAGKLIMDAGLKGYSVGGACVSEKHCGFVVNKGNATAADIIRLMKDVADKVEAEFGVRLEPEVKIIG